MSEVNAQGYAGGRMSLSSDSVLSTPALGSDLNFKQLGTGTLTHCHVPPGGCEFC